MAGVQNNQVANDKSRRLNRAAVLAAIYSRGLEGVQMSEIVQATGLSKTACQNHINALEDDGKAERTRGFGSVVIYGPPGTMATNKRQAPRQKNPKSWNAHLELESWANHVPVHRIVKAHEAKPIRPAGPASVWGLA